MPFAAISRIQILASIILITFVLFADATVITNAFLELFLMGRVPGTELAISIEAFFAGAVCVSWSILTYNFTLSAIDRIARAIKQTPSAELEEIAL